MSTSPTSKVVNHSPAAEVENIPSVKSTEKSKPVEKPVLKPVKKK
jgi:hypothetical protein